MLGNEIIAEIHGHREAIARECGYDVAEIMAYYRRRETECEDADHPLVSFVKEVAASESCVIREDPPKT